LKYGVSLQQAQTEMDAIALRLKPLFVGRPNVIPGAFDGATLMDLRHNMTRASRSGLWLVFGAVAAVFLIACVNVVGLLLANAEDRKRELAIRAAIGADRATLARQLLIETGVLAAIGGTAGWLLSMVALPAVLNRIPPWLQLVGDPQLDARSVVFVGILALVTVIAGVLPAFRSSADAPRAALAIGTVRASPSRRGRHALILVEVALATILLCAGSIMLRSSLILHSQDTGMDAARVIAVRSIPAGAPDPSRRALHNVRVAEALRRVPGVESVALVDLPLLQKAVKGSRFIPPAQTQTLGSASMETDLTVTPEYFQTMGLVLRMGRTLTSDDRGRRVVISETLAKRYWPGRNPVGETIRYGDGTREIAGVVSDARDVSLDRPPMPTLYHVWDEKDAPIATMVIRFGGRAAMLMPEIRRAVRIADDDAAITMLSTVEDLLTASVAERDFNTQLFATFAVAGLLVALVGIYGLVAFLVARGTRDMGIRLALGANGRRLELSVMAGTLRWVAAGLGVGMGVTLLCTQYLRPFVYEVPANDPATLVTVAALFLVVAAIATYIPARRAARVDPTMALRAE
jgi:predicted permease